MWLAFALLCLIWGSSYLFIRLGLRQLSPLALVGLRLSVGFIVIATVVAYRRQSLWLGQSQLAYAFILATINTSLPFLLIAWGEVTVPSGLASVLTSTVPIFSVLLAAAVLQDEPVTMPKIGGVAIGFAGVMLLLSRDLTQGSIRWSTLLGQGAIVLAAVCYAIGAVFARRTMRGVASLTVATYALAISGLETLTLTLIASRPSLTSLTSTSIWAVLWLGVFGSGLAYILAYYILEEWGAGRYTFIAYMLPMVGLTLGAIFLNEVVDWRILAGSGLVIGGVGLASITRRQSQSTMPGTADRIAAE
ncbi:MAG: DMT family transporter [Chloroflexota bacterium]